MTEVVDISQMLEAKSDELVADDLMGGDRVLLITRVDLNGADAKKFRLHYAGDNGKPWRPCKGMCRVLAHGWRSNNAATYVGRSVKVFRYADAIYGGKKVGGVRVKGMSHIAAPFSIPVKESRTLIKEYKIEALASAEQGARQSNPNAAADWTAAFIAKVNGAPTSDDLNAYVAKQIAKLDRLPDDLRTQADAAVSDMLAKFHPTEGRADADMGEGFTDAPEDF